MAVRSVEVVVAAKGAAATVAAKEEVAKEGAAVVEETVSGSLCSLARRACRGRNKDEGSGIEDGDWERADEGFVFKTIDASCSRRLVGIVAEVGVGGGSEGGGRPATTSSFFA